MTWLPLSIPPGIYRNGTEFQAKGRYYDANLVRFYQGAIRPVGGWDSVSQSVLTGTGRAIITWRANDGSVWAAVGTNTKLYAMNILGQVFDITPFRSTGTLGSNPFATVVNSPIVTVTHTGHGAETGDTVVYSGATAVAGLTLNGAFILTYIDANSYTIMASIAANATTTGGGASVTFSYEISVGLADASTSLGYGAGIYGDGVYGSPRMESGVVTEARVWRLDTWGQYLEATYSPDGGIYEWQLNTGARALIVTNAPSADGMFVTADRIQVALGAAGNPRNVAWCDQEANTSWTPAVTNQAGAFNLQTAGRLVCGKKVPGGNLIFTSVDVWFMQYLGGSLVYGFNKVGDGCGIAAPGAVGTSDVLAVWMGRGGTFWYYDGYVHPLTCDVLDYIFSNFNLAQISKVWCHYIAQFGEFWFGFPSSNSVEIDSYVTWSPGAALGSQWNIGQMSRLCGADLGAFSFPLRVGSDGFVYQHESGTLDLTQVTPYLETGPVELGNGDRIMNIMNYIPDEKTAGDVEITIKTKLYPNAPETSSGPFLAANPRNIRLSGRQAKIRYTGITGNDWRVGTPRLDVRPGSMR